MCERASLFGAILVALTLGMTAADNASAQATVRVSVDSSGRQTLEPSAEPTISADGRYVAFHSSGRLVLPDVDTGAFAGDDVFVRDVTSGATTRASLNSAGAEESGDSWGVSISANGQAVAFTSQARLTGGVTRSYSDVFYHQRDRLGRTLLVSTSPTGSAANRNSDKAVGSGNGLHVAFASSASNLVADDTNAA